jgi:hypothetical protein
VFEDVPVRVDVTKAVGGRHPRSSLSSPRPSTPSGPAERQRDDAGVTTERRVLRVNCSVSKIVVDCWMNVKNRDLNLILAALFELRLTCLENQRTWNAIGDLAELLGGDRSAMFFGAPAPERSK